MGKPAKHAGCTDATSQRCDHEPGGVTVCQLAIEGSETPAGPWPNTRRRLPVMADTVLAGHCGVVAGQGVMDRIHVTVPLSNEPARLPVCVKYVMSE